MKKLVFLFFILTLFVYFITSAGKTPYDYFTRLSLSLLEGKYYLTQNPPWLSELITIGEHKYTFVNPPMPAFLAIPFVLLFKDNFQQQYLAHLIGAGITAITMLISWSIKKDKKLLIWTGILSGLGNIIWYLSSTGSVWYLGQITSVFFISLALYESLNNGDLLILGLLLSAAFLSRLQTLPCLMLFIFLNKEKLNFKNLIRFGLGLSIFIFVYGIYNFLRFGNPLQTGYALIPGILKEPWFDQGQFSFLYIPNHLKIIFTGLPKITNKIPYIYPSWAGLAIWITTPAFIFSIFSKIKDKLTKILWFTILAIALINFSYGSTGFTQFGYRYAVDFYPFLFLLTIKGIAQTGVRWYHWLFLFLGVIVNIWGVIFINKFGWVGF